MQIAYFEKQTAYQSEEIWKSFLHSCKSMGIQPVENSLEADCAVIWSVLWKGRLLDNQKIYYNYRNLNKPVFIIEVGSLIRGKTWKISINNITKQGIYANYDNLIPNRVKKLGLVLEKYKILKNRPILIAGQHDKSLQWTYPSSNQQWIREKIKEVRNFTDKIIHVRPHPRNFFREDLGKNVILEIPAKIPLSYDQYDLNFDYHAIINHNSGVSVQAAQHGTPIICDESSLASDVSVNFNNLARPTVIDRETWFERIVHTEWTREEIEEGVPLKRLLSKVDLTQPI